MVWLWSLARSEWSSGGRHQDHSNRHLAAGNICREIKSYEKYFFGWEKRLIWVQFWENSAMFLYLQVIPQLIARIDTPRALVGRLIHQLLTDIGRYHPQVSLLILLEAIFQNTEQPHFFYEKLKAVPSVISGCSVFTCRLWSTHWLWLQSPPLPPATMLPTRSWRTCVNTATP